MNTGSEAARLILTKLSRFSRRLGLFPAVVVLALTAPSWAASPCAGVDRAPKLEHRIPLEAEIAKQLHVKKIRILRSFRLGTWTIFYVETYETDNGYVFYAHDPLKSRYVTEWGGIATPDEERSIKSWVLKNAPGIPHRLASCFAWRVTRE